MRDLMAMLMIKGSKLWYFKMASTDVRRLQIRLGEGIDVRDPVVIIPDRWIISI